MRSNKLFDQTWTQVEFGHAVGVTKQEYKFGLLPRRLTGIIDELKSTIVRKREKMVQSRIVNAASSTYSETDGAGNYTVTITGGDGVSLASSAHTREDAGTDNNNIVFDGTNYNPSASYNGLKALERTAALVLNPKGNQMYIEPKRIFVRRVLVPVPSL